MICLKSKEKQNLKRRSLETLIEKKVPAYLSESVLKDVLQLVVFPDTSTMAS